MVFAALVQQLQIFFEGLRRHQIERVLDALARIAGRRVELEPAGFDPREIQDVARELDQRLRAHPDRLRVLPPRI